MDKIGCGISSSYLLDFTDEEWTNFTIDEVMALYLIDLADLLKARRRSVDFYRTAACLIYFLRECIKDHLRASFEAISTN